MKCTPEFLTSENWNSSLVLLSYFGHFQCNYRYLQNACPNYWITGNRKNLMMSSIMPFSVKRGICGRKQNITHKMNAQRTIVKRCLNDTFKVKLSILVKNQGVEFTLKISANRRFGTYARLVAWVAKNWYEFTVKGRSTNTVFQGHLFTYDWMKKGLWQVIFMGCLTF